MSGKNISDIVKNILLILKNSLGQMRFICAKYLKNLVLVQIFHLKNLVLVQIRTIKNLVLVQNFV